MEEKKSTALADVAHVVRSLYAHNLLSGKTALVTGASRGIGRAVAVGLAALGAKVIVNYAGNAAAAEDTLSEIKKNNGDGHLIQFDVANFTVVQETIKNLEKEFGAIEILVNNAGVCKDNLFVKFKEEEWDANLNTNLKGAFNCTRALAMSMMRKRAGKVINISSVIGLTGNAGQTAYAASKSGLLGFTRSLAQELGSRNVHINAICPGYFTTDMTGALPPDTASKIVEKIPLQQLGDPVEIAKAVIFLASPAASYITGQTLAVDGGMTMY